MRVAVHWFRRDLRLEDNTALNAALRSGLPVLPLFIFDRNILDDLPRDDARVSFIHERLSALHEHLAARGGGLLGLTGTPVEVFGRLLEQYEIAEVYCNKDYEPYAIARDHEIGALLTTHGVVLRRFKDQVIFEESEVVKEDASPYTVFTPYKNKWLQRFGGGGSPLPFESGNGNLMLEIERLPTLEQLGFVRSPIHPRPFNRSQLQAYATRRDFPAIETTHLGAHIRFGTIGNRQVIAELSEKDSVFLSELIWREFFMQILFHFPHVVRRSFKPQYCGIQWRNDEAEFERWCQGNTGYPLVDAGMRELNATGFMHNRVRMVTASFLCKHLLIDWRWGEAYFATKLLDYELSSNNGNWQWAAGTGCDAAPYFRIFNPSEQLKKFDKDLVYVRRWVPEWGRPEYPAPMVDHALARARALETYKSGIAWSGLQAP